MATDTDIDFRASDLIGTAGVGSNGEKLVNTLLDHYPPDLQAALLKRINPELDNEIRGKESALRKVAKIAGVERIADVAVRGGERHVDDAVVTYAFLDDKGTVWKGCFPYKDLDSGSSDAHVSQRDSLAASSVAKQHVRENPRAAQSAGTGASDPLALLDAPADELVRLMDENPDRADQIKALEKTRKSPRKSVLEHEPASDDGE